MPCVPFSTGFWKTAVVVGFGLIAEDLAQIPVFKDLIVNYNEQGQPDSVNYDRIAIALIPLLQSHENRLAKLEGTNGTTNW